MIPGCWAKKPLLGGRAGDPGGKANQEVKLSCQLNNLGRMWLTAARFAIALNAACVPTSLLCMQSMAGCPGHSPELMDAAALELLDY